LIVFQQLKPLEAVRPEPQVPTEDERVPGARTKASDISDMRELGYFSVKTNSRTCNIPINLKYSEAYARIVEYNANYNNSRPGKL
jgi:hypothetical protein